jgi:hypothetical protein
MDEKHIQQYIDFLQDSAKSYDAKPNEVNYEKGQIAQKCVWPATLGVLISLLKGGKERTSSMKVNKRASAI